MVIEFSRIVRFMSRASAECNFGAAKQAQPFAWPGSFGYTLRVEQAFQGEH
jgi:hypothetical protein